MFQRILRSSIFLLLATASAASLSAQTIMVSGIVRDTTTNEPIAGVAVIDKVGNRAEITGPDGDFVINVRAGTELCFSFLGYYEKVVDVTPSMTELTVYLHEWKQMIDATVIVGYGSQKKSSSVASLTQTDGESLVQSATGVTNVTEALQGMLPGVIAINTNSMPGDESTSIMIRGKGTWGNTSPLILVDGIERDMNNLDMNEIDKVTVLKDASATAVYGVKGANGVILITTKQGVSTRPVVSFTANFGMKQLTDKSSFADPITTMEMYNEAARNEGLWDNVISESVIEAWRQNIDKAGPYNQYFPLIDMWDEITKPVGFSHNYNVNVSGGTDFVKYFASLGYLRDGDIFDTQKQEKYDPRFYYDRINWRTNLVFNVTRTTKLSVRLSGNMGTQNAPAMKLNSENNWGNSDFYDKIYYTSTFEFPLVYEDGAIGDSIEGTGNIKMSLNNAGQRQAKVLDSFTDISLDQDLSFITKGLSFSAKLAYTLKTRRSSLRYYEGAKETGIEKVPFVRYYRKYDLSSPIYNDDGSIDYPLLTESRFPVADSDGYPAVLGEYDTFKSSSQKLYYEFALNYARSFDKHNVTALVLMNRNTIDTSSGASKMAFPRHEESWVGRVTYNYAERYLVEFNGAYNGSEKFAPGKRFGFFPSASVGWRISEEPFVKKHTGKWLDEFKVRYSYGVVGSDNGAGRFNYIQIYNKASAIKFGETSAISTTPLYVAGQAADPNATWERAIKQNLGFELALFGKLDINLDFFQENRSGILMNYRTIPLWTGVQTPSGNIGKTQNRGFELEVIWNHKVNDSWTYWIRGNMTMNQNRIIYRDDPKNMSDYLKDAGKPIGWISAYLNNGYYTSLDDIYNSPAASLGVSADQLIPGDLSYIDFNADGIINTLDRAPLKYVSYPMNTAGLTLGFSWKGLSVSAMFYGVFNTVKSNQKVLWDFYRGNMMAQEDVTGRWTPENAADGTVVKPALHINYTKHSQDNNTAFTYRNGNYIRLKNAEISYSFTGKALKVVGLSKAQVYVNGNNLFTWTPLDRRLDPETNGTSVYPIVRRYNIGARLTF